MHDKHLPRPTARHMVAHLRSMAATRGPDTALIALSQAGETCLDYAALDRRARAIAAELQGRFAVGERALLLLDNDEHYVAAFFACLYAGLIAVPVFPPESAREQHLARLVAIAADCEAACVLGSSTLLALVGEQVQRLAPACIAVDSVPEARADDWREHAPADGDIAFLQYTSGSTASPKGVMVSHANLMANERAIEASMSVRDDDVFVSWLPLYHDMGLIGGLLQALFRGLRVVLMSPQYFLERPVRWLQAISRHRGTISGGPDFAFRLCLERVKPAQLEGLDLSSWRVAFSGAEPVRHDTLQGFVERFAPAGFAASAVYPCYGLAEATLLVSGGVRGTGMVACGFDTAALGQGRARPVAAQGSTLVACGGTPPEHRVQIVAPEGGQPLPDGEVGEIWVAGPSIAGGYWRRPEDSAASFVAHPGGRWLRTGDLGFWHDGQLYIAGRLKDLIILRGRNLYPQDIEQAVEAEVEAVRKGRVAAFAVPGVDGGEGVGLAAEVSRGLQKLVPPAALVEALQQVVSGVCGEAAAVVVLLQPGGLPKTSSGKLQRAACRRRWQDGSLDAYAIHEHGRFTRGGDASPAAASAPQGETEQALAALWQQVLGAAPTREAHFFSAGGNSLRAVRLAARIAGQWGIDCPAPVVFEHPRLQALAAEIDRRRTAGGGSTPVAIPRLAHRDGPLPLSPAQQRQWFLWQLQPQDSAYHLGGMLHLKGQLDVAALQAALDALVLRHESLRTVFGSGADGRPVQRIQPTAAVQLEQHDLRSSPPGQAGSQARALLEQAFDLTRGPLLRAALQRLAEDEHRLVVVMHHIVSDGASMQILVDEWLALYAAAIAGQPAGLAPLPLQYADHAAWLHAGGALGQAEEARLLAYWRAQLGDEHPVLRLPADRPRGAAGSQRAAAHTFALPAALVAGLRGTAAAQDATLFMTLLAGFQALLHRWSGQADLRIGVPASRRDRLEAEGVIGFFVDTLVLRNQVHGRLPLAQVLAQARVAALGAQSHAGLSFDRLVELLQPPRSREHTPLFQVMHNHRDEAVRVLRAVPGLGVELQAFTEPTAQFELVLDTVELPDGGVQATLTYAGELFEPATIERLARHYRTLLQALAQQPGQAVADVPLLDEAELALLRQWGEAPAATIEAGSLPVHHLIEQRAAHAPQAPALVFGEEVLTYAELDARAGRLAQRLLATGLPAQARVGLAVERGIGMVVAVLAILKAGAAYVPLDPAYPRDRLAGMVADSGLDLLLAQAAVRERVPDSGVPVLELDAPAAAAADAARPLPAVHGQQLAYVIYTSGSTGRPKGVAVAHQALAAHVQAAIGWLGLVPGDRVLQFATISFDAFVEQCFATLCAGAALVLRGEALWDSETFHRELLARRISVADLTTAYWQLLVQDAARQGRRDFGALRLMVAGGEAMTAPALAAWRAAMPSTVRLLNAYGPTEAVVTACAWACPAQDDGCHAEQAPPIGRPLPGRRLHVLDAELQPVPPGVAGELYIGGALLARGYLQRPGLTAERFVADPFDVAGGRLYRSGDRVRWRADGQLEHLGRVDEQVKIRGLRIEPGELRACLLAEPGVQDAAVQALPGPAGLRLVAWVAPQSLDAAALRERLAARLPEHLLPSAIVVLPALPLGPGGKLDRQALPVPGGGDDSRHEAPQGEAEAALAALWAEVLGLPRVGRHDNFFELGGHSLAAVQVTALLQQRHGCELPVRRFFEQPTLAALAAGLPTDWYRQAASRQDRLAEMDRLLNDFEA
ncbi:non-ribosomal peptide synthetase [Eleftheria terrae]|uniref:non-ribosomal peptide synthetase n=1 Tax=Eleftheria terrae TaxID=1597781 RepID=UPI00263B79C3|nr:non-ribosomal peptide synthetase [Eleftheria terrae]WKB55458.1 amino acid adenylation domain-containing protein [Eleftheria terrae]